MRLGDLRGRRRNLSGIELRPEHFENPLELLAVPVKAGSVYELYMSIIGDPAPDAVTVPMLRLYGIESDDPSFNMTPDDPNLYTNGTTEGEPWRLSQPFTRALVIKKGVLRISAWVADLSNPGVAPVNSLAIDRGMLIIREI